MKQTVDPSRNFPDAREDVENWDRHPETPQTRSASYRLTRTQR